MLNKKYRLTKSGSFTYVYNKGKHSGEKYLSLIYVSSHGAPKVGFNISNKIGKATVRNLVKRRLRAILRGYLPQLKAAQIVISAKVGVTQLSYLQLKGSVDRLIKRSNLLNL